MRNDASLRTYTVSQLARLSGTSVRTLHHYDEIGLLKPASVGDNGYRYYGREEMLRLQQILFNLMCTGSSASPSARSGPCWIASVPTV